MIFGRMEKEKPKKSKITAFEAELGWASGSNVDAPLDKEEHGSSAFLQPRHDRARRPLKYRERRHSRTTGSV
jgi:hypothetical protein